MKPWYEIHAKQDSQETEIVLFDSIGGSGFKALIAEIKKVAPSNRILLSICSPGGSVLAGNAIFSALAAHKGGCTTQIIGIAASMASVVALAGKPVKMAGNAMMMIHNVSTSIDGGDAGDLRQAADRIEKVQDTLIAIYVGKTKLPRQKIKNMMDAETWMKASEALALGFVDEVTGDAEMAAHFDFSRFRNYHGECEVKNPETPEEARKLVARYEVLKGRARSIFFRDNEAALMAAGDILGKETATPAVQGEWDGKTPQTADEATALIARYQAMTGRARSIFFRDNHDALMDASKLIERVGNA